MSDTLLRVACPVCDHTDDIPAGDVTLTAHPTTGRRILQWDCPADHEGRHDSVGRFLDPERTFLVIAAGVNIAPSIDPTTSRTPGNGVFWGFAIAGTSGWAVLAAWFFSRVL